jgi:hypothetical protein
MDIDLAALPGDVETLQRMVRLLAAERTSLSEAEAETERLHLIIKKLQRSQFGGRAERLDDNQLQLGLEDLNADIATAEAILPSTKTKTPRTQDERPSLPVHLPREDVRFDVEVPGLALLWRRAPSDRRDGERDARPCAGTPPGHPHLRPRYGCRVCDTTPTRHRLRSGRSPRAWRPRPCSLMSWSPSPAITCRSTGKARCLPGRASRSIVRGQLGRRRLLVPRAAAEKAR